MRECYEIDFNGPQPFEIPALVLAALARPDEGETKARESLYNSLCVWLIQQRAALEPDWARAPQPIKPIYLSWPAAQVAKDLRTFHRRVRDRLTAGQLAVAFLQERETGGSAKLPPGARRLSLNELAPTVLEDLGFADYPENVEARVWRPSLPVIHLCVAWAVSVQEAQRERARTPTVVDLYLDPSFLALVLARAEMNVPLLAKSQLKFAPEKLIRFSILRSGVKSNDTP
jgi:hypothetical protein